MNKYWLLAAAALTCLAWTVPQAKASAGIEIPASGIESFDTLSDFLPVQDGGPPPERKAPRPFAEKRGERLQDSEGRREKILERIEKMPPEERAEALERMEEMKAKREALKEELKDLPPEEREARMEELRAEWEQDREQKREEFRKQFQERWENAGPDERAQFCVNARERCAEGGNHACEFASQSCGGQ